MHGVHGLARDLRQHLHLRSREVVPLQQVNAQIAQAQRFLARLDALGDYGDAELGAHARDRVRDEAPYAVLVNVARQSHVDLDDVRLELREQIQPRMAGPEIIDRRAHAVAFVFGEDRHQMVRVARGLILGDFEDDLLLGEAGARGRFERGADAGGRLVDRIGQKVDAEQAAHLQLSGQGDRLDPASLVKSVAIFIRDAAEDLMGAAPAEGTHQGLVRIYRAAFAVDDGLERHGELGCDAGLAAHLAALGSRGTGHDRVPVSSSAGYRPAGAQLEPLSAARPCLGTTL